METFHAIDRIHSRNEHPLFAQQPSCPQEFFRAFQAIGHDRSTIFRCHRRTPSGYYQEHNVTISFKEQWVKIHYYPLRPSNLNKTPCADPHQAIVGAGGEKSPMRCFDPFQLTVKIT
jgi:hypothetical protein